DSNVVANIKARVEAALSRTTAAVSPSDVRGHWAERTIDLFVKLGIIEGYEDGLARPDQSITRAEFATILSRVFDISGGTNPMTLGDVRGHWAHSYIEILVQAGVINGYEDGACRPDTEITREEMVMMIDRIVNMDKVPKDTTKRITDEVADWASDAVRDS